MSEDKIGIITKILKQKFFSDNSCAIDRASNITHKNDHFIFSLDATGLPTDEAQSAYRQLTDILQNKLHPSQVSIVLTTHKQGTNSSKQSGLQHNSKTDNKIIIPQVRKVILIASGKGGVGKSTVTAIIASHLAKQGKKIGILDADIYGPSMPHMFNLQGKPQLLENKMLPLSSSQGIKVNSIGFLTGADEGISWRGPMVAKALYQLLSLTHWGQLDYLLIDSPPGTGDIHLSLVQNYAIDGALIVTTPQKIAMIDADRSINMYQKLEVPILGIIKNMAPAASSEGDHSIFTGDGAETLATKHGVKILANIVFSAKIAEYCDLGLNLSDITILDSGLFSALY
jgi:ATP-binding protein involved in chromosome partitioning